MSARPAQSVWPVTQQTARAQRRGRYLPASTAHPGKMLPELARNAIRAYSDVGELVLDPMCGIGTTLVEAVHLGRRAIGVELEPRWAAISAANLCLARDQGATGRGLVTRGDARRLGLGLLDELQGRVQLILSSPPYGDSLHGHVRKRPDRVEKYDDRYSHNPDNLAQLPRRQGRRGRPPFSTALGEIIAGCRRLLAPAGFLVLTARPYRRRGELVDLPGQVEQLALDAGLELYDRLVALLCGLRGGELVPRTSFFQLQKQRCGATPRMLLIAHEDVLVFRKTRRPRPTRARSRTR
ncbi:MAG: TRM11 family SAM-dependent methyltransferase [Gaiellaceae bacterium]